jgi:hypothetical protein
VTRTRWPHLDLTQRLDDGPAYSTCSSIRYAAAAWKRALVVNFAECAARLRISDRHPRADINPAGALEGRRVLQRVHRRPPDLGSESEDAPPRGHPRSRAFDSPSACADAARTTTLRSRCRGARPRRRRPRSHRAHCGATRALRPRPSRLQSASTAPASSIPEGLRGVSGCGSGPSTGRSGFTARASDLSQSPPRPGGGRAPRNEAARQRITARGSSISPSAQADMRDTAAVVAECLDQGVE